MSTSKKGNKNPKKANKVLNKDPINDIHHRKLLDFFTLFLCFLVLFKLIQVNSRVKTKPTGANQSYSP